MNHIARREVPKTDAKFFGRPKIKILTPKINYGPVMAIDFGGFVSMESVGSAAYIANMLAADVHSGALRPGEMFPSERDLCERFEVGRSIVRDGMTILQGMGLADHSKGKRPRVAEPTLSRVMLAASEAAQFFFKDNEGTAHLLQARLFLETSMVRFAVNQASNAQIAKMVGAVEACDANINDLAEFRRADALFHRALAEVAGNPIFVALHETFVERLMKNAPQREDYSAHNKASNAGHKQIMKAILAKDAEGAVQALTAHLTRNYETGYHRKLANKVTENS